MPRNRLYIVALSFLSFALPCIAQESRWGTADDDTVKFMTAVESKWASSACSSQPDLKAVIADDFQGTSTKGRRYGKDEAITTDTTSLSRDCQLGELRIRFFGDSIAVAYGAESAQLSRLASCVAGNSPPLLWCTVAGDST